jgi:N-acetylglutamate synthase
VIERRSQRRIDASAADVGKRITLRYRLDGPGRDYTEAVGVLVRWSGVGDEGVLMIRRRDDTTVRIGRRSIEYARVLPPELSAYRMQELAEQTWPPTEWLDLGAWRLRWSGARAGRANSVRVAGKSDRTIAAALALTANWYGDRGATPLLQVPHPSPVDETYDAAGWTVVRRSRLMVASTQRLIAASGSSQRSDMAITRSDRPDEEWLSLLSGDDVGARQEIEPILVAPREPVFVSCRSADTGELLGIARGVRLGEWAGANNMVTAPAARRHGVATAIMGSLIDWGSDLGVSRWFLRVHSDSEPALNLYDRLGFSRHHDYVYRAPADADPAAAESQLEDPGQ